jgi:enoyl-CoA hydratase/carnithine racemase
MQPADVRVEQQLAWIEFGDPAQRNVLDEPVLQGLIAALQQAEAAGARVVVLAGRGDAWSAGYDVARIPADLFATDPGVVAAHPFERCMRAIAELPVPVIAALRGVVFGGALELAISCDLRLACAGTQFGFTPARLGIVYSHTGLTKLTRLLGPAPARLLAFTGRTIGAAEACRIGLVHDVLTDEAFASGVRGLADEIAGAAPLAVQGMKRILSIVERGTPVSADDVRAILRLRHAAFASADFAEGRRAFAEKRPPRFEGR